LGLVSRQLVETQGGSIDRSQVRSGGCLVRIALPVGNGDS
jgi:hypothetical protein